MITGGEVIGAAEVVQRIRGVGPATRFELRGAIDRLSIRLQRNVKDKLNGEVLKVRTGRLRHSIEQVVVNEGEKISGIVSTPVKYAPIHEYGFHGTEQVRAHMRTVKQAFGRPISPVTSEVSAHSRKVDLPERSFLRSALREMEASGVIGEEIGAAAQRAVA